MKSMLEICGGKESYQLGMGFAFLLNSGVSLGFGWMAKELYQNLLLGILWGIIAFITFMGIAHFMFKSFLDYDKKEKMKNEIIR